MTAKPFRGGTFPSDLSKYIYGTTRLGDDSILRESRVAQARAAMNTGVWFHTSDQYGDALDVLPEEPQGEDRFEGEDGFALGKGQIKPGA